MKQVIIEMEEDEHAALKDRAAQSFRKIPQQLLYEALHLARQLNATPKPRRKAKPPATPVRRKAKAEAGKEGA